MAGGNGRAVVVVTAIAVIIFAARFKVAELERDVSQLAGAKLSCQGQGQHGGGGSGVLHLGGLNWMVYATMIGRQNMIVAMSKRLYRHLRL
jgi:hypothetical protein